MQITLTPPRNANHGHTLAMPISRAKLTHSIEKIEAVTATLPEATRAAVRSLFLHGRDQHLSLADLGHLIGYDASTVSKLFNGKYTADDLTDLTAAITDALQQSINPTIHQSINPIIAPTSVVTQVEDLCLLAWLKRRIVFIFGPTQAGKTTALRHFQTAHPEHPWANLPGKTPRTGSVKIVNCPANGGARGLLNNLAIAYNVSPQSSWEDLKLRAFNRVSPDDLIIIDEFSQCFDPVSGSVKVRTVRLAREIWNHCQCGLVIVMTDIAKDEMQKSKFVKICNELWFRKAAALQLAPLPADADLKLVATTHGLPIPGPGQLKVIRDLVLQGGMTQYATLLEMAADYAADAGHPNWTHFTAAHDLIKNFASGS